MHYRPNKTQYMHSKPWHHGSNGTTLSIIAQSMIPGQRKNKKTNRWSKTPTKSCLTPRPTTTAQSYQASTSLSLGRIDAQHQEQLEPRFTNPPTIPSASWPPYRKTMGNDTRGGNYHGAKLERSTESCGPHRIIIRQTWGLLCLICLHTASLHRWPDYWQVPNQCTAHRVIIHGDHVMASFHRWKQDMAKD